MRAEATRPRAPTNPEGHNASTHSRHGPASHALLWRKEKRIWRRYCMARLRLCAIENCGVGGRFTPEEPGALRNRRLVFLPLGSQFRRIIRQMLDMPAI